MSEKYWWVSWYTTEDLESFECGWPWWVSGYAFDPERVIIIAAVIADSEEEVWEYINDSYDSPTDLEHRFCELIKDGDLRANKSGRWPVAEDHTWPICWPTPTRRGTMEKQNG